MRSYRRRQITANCTIDAVIVHLRNARHFDLCARSFRRVLVLNAGHHFGHEKLNVWFNYSKGPSRWSDLVEADKSAPKDDERPPFKSVGGGSIYGTASTQSPKWNSFTVLQTVSPSHYAGGGWRDGGSCGATEPSSSIGESYRKEFDAQRGPPTPSCAKPQTRRSTCACSTSFNVSALRPDAHPGRYGELRPGVRDCSHSVLCPACPACENQFRQFLQHTALPRVRKRRQVPAGLRQDGIDYCFAYHRPSRPALMRRRPHVSSEATTCALRCGNSGARRSIPSVLDSRATDRCCLQDIVTVLGAVAFDSES